MLVSADLHEGGLSGCNIVAAAVGKREAPVLLRVAQGGHRGGADAVRAGAAGAEANILARLRRRRAVLEPLYHICAHRRIVKKKGTYRHGEASRELRAHCWKLGASLVLDEAEDLRARFTVSALRRRERREKSEKEQLHAVCRFNELFARNTQNSRSSAGFARPCKARAQARMIVPETVPKTVEKGNTLGTKIKTRVGGSR